MMKMIKAGAAAVGLVASASVFGLLGGFLAVDANYRDAQNSVIRMSPPFCECRTVVSTDKPPARVCSPPSCDRGAKS